MYRTIISESNFAVNNDFVRAFRPSQKGFLPDVLLVRVTCIFSCYTFRYNKNIAKPEENKTKIKQELYVSCWYNAE